MHPKSVLKLYGNDGANFKIVSSCKYDQCDNYNNWYRNKLTAQCSLFYH